MAAHNVAHGPPGRPAYQRGCRCAICREANTAYSRATRQANRRVTNNDAWPETPDGQSKTITTETPCPECSEYYLDIPPSRTGYICPGCGYFKTRIESAGDASEPRSARVSKSRGQLRQERIELRHRIKVALAAVDAILDDVYLNDRTRTEFEVYREDIAGCETLAELEEILDEARGIRIKRNGWHRPSKRFDEYDVTEGEIVEDDEPAAIESGSPPHPSLMGTIAGRVAQNITISPAIMSAPDSERLARVMNQPRFRPPGICEWCFRDGVTYNGRGKEYPAAHWRACVGTPLDDNDELRPVQDLCPACWERFRQICLERGIYGWNDGRVRTEAQKRQEVSGGQMNRLWYGR